MWKFFKIHVSGFCAFQFILNFVFHCAKQSSGLSVFLYYLRTKFCFKQKEISVLSLQDSSGIPSPSLLLSSEFELINVPTLQLLNPIKMPYSHGPSLTPSPDSCGCFVWAWVGKECLGGEKKKNIFLMNILKIREEEIFKQTWQMCCDN